MDEDAARRGIAYAIGCVAFLVLGAYLWMVHRQHFGAIVFYGLALACPLMHVFGHRGHRHGPEP